MVVGRLLRIHQVRSELPVVERLLAGRLTLRARRVQVDCRKLVTGPVWRGRRRP